MITRVAARVRNLVADTFAPGDEDKQIQLSPSGELVVALGLPELAELTRLGDTYQVITSTAQAAATGVPTTDVGLAIWNGENDSGKSYIIHSIGCVEVVVDATQQNQIGLFAMNNVTPVTAITSAGLTIRSTVGKVYDGKARTLLTGTAVTNDGWFPCGEGTTPASAGAVAGGAWRVTDIPLRGLYIVPPKGMFAIKAVKTVATASQIQYFIRWSERRLQLA